jgi:hypothetical protein
MTPWILLAALLAAINWAGFIAVRGRWGRMAPALAIASLAGTGLGETVGAATGLEIVRVGDFHVVSACVGAQLAMLVTLLGAAVLPSRSGADEGA